MKQLFSISVMVYLLLALGIAKADPVSDLENVLGNFSSMTANFSQKILDPSDVIIQRSNGSMALKRPGKFLWKIQSPNKQLVVTNGGKVWLYDIDLEQVTEQRLTQTSVGLSPAMLLTGSIDEIQQQFRITEPNKSKAHQSFMLQPKQSSDLFKWVELIFTKGKLQSIRVADNLGQTTIFQFTDIKINPKIADKRFNFKAPKGVDVIKEQS